MLRNGPKTDSGVYPLVAHVRRSTRLSLRFSLAAGQRSCVNIQRKEGETGNEAKFNIYAVKDCVLGLHLADDQSIADIATLPLATFLPHVEDCIAIRKEFIILVAQVLIRYIPWFERLQPVISDHIPHEYTDIMASESEIVSHYILLLFAT